MNRKTAATGLLATIAALSLGGVNVFGLGIFTVATEIERGALLPVIGLSEPASLALFGTGLWAVATVKRRRADRQRLG